MDNFTKVELRKSKELKEVKITAVDKPSINESTISKWQNIINIISSLINVPSGLIMKITNESMEVFISSDTKENPYQAGDSDHLGRGLYCETVIGEDKPLHVNNALKDKVWKDNPDVSLNMISYYGLPLKWSDGEFFGTICVLDDKTNEFSQLYKDLMSEFRNAIESDLKVLEDKRGIEFLLNSDILTGISNRRKINSDMVDAFNRYKRSQVGFCILMFDLDEFKKVNDSLGHNIGDQVLKIFTNTISKNIRTVDSFGRWGGDEFILLCYNTHIEYAEELVRRLKESLDLIQFPNNVKFSVSIGISEIYETDSTIDDVISRADKDMYYNKKQRVK